MRTSQEHCQHFAESGVALTRIGGRPRRAETCGIAFTTQCYIHSRFYVVIACQLLAVDAGHAVCQAYTVSTSLTLLAKSPCDCQVFIFLRDAD